jgi:hypothetical protein
MMAQQQPDGASNVRSTNNNDPINTSITTTTLLAEISPIQQVLLQCATVVVSPNVSRNTAIPTHEPIEDTSTSVHFENDNNLNPDDPDDQILQTKKAVQRNQRNIDQEMKWIGMIRKSIKVLLATIDATATHHNNNNNTTTALFSQKQMANTISNKTD